MWQSGTWFTSAPLDLIRFEVFSSLNDFMILAEEPTGKE